MEGLASAKPEEKRLAYAKPEDLPYTLTVDETAEMPRINRDTAYNMIHAGTIPAVRLGRRIFVPRDPLLKWLNSCGQEKELPPGLRGLADRRGRPSPKR